MNGLHPLRPQSASLARTENWKPVVGYEGFYEVSDLGHVRSLDRIVTKANRWGGTTECRQRGRMMKFQPKCDGSGYLFVMLWGDGNRKRENALVHRLVLRAFVGPADGRDGAHNDGDSSNNRLTNLRYATRSENCADKIVHGTNLVGEKVPGAKLTEHDVRRIRCLSGTMPQSEIAAMFGVGQMTISRAIRGETWRHVDGV